jgi:endonuclease/exonuclease/phosphatase family metal-dependent hydrolase
VIRVSTFNVENLFSRPEVLNMKDNDRAAEILAKINDLTGLLERQSYAPHKAEIERLYKDVRDRITINIRSSEGLRSLFTGEGKLLARGRSQWDGFVDLKRERFSEEQIKFTGKVIKTVKADIQCLIEVESADTFGRFNTDILGSLFPDRIVIDGNDPRGIDIALGTKKGFPIKTAKTNIFARKNNKTIFSRDCLEVEIAISKSRSLHVLVNHFKAKDKTPEISDAKRTLQAEEVSRILKERYDLKKDLVIVAGDLNDEPDSKPLAKLMKTPGLHNVFDIVDRPEDDRWTYYYGADKQYNTIDYLLVSQALRPKVADAGMERRGMYNLAELTDGQQKPFPGITDWKLGASDHAAAWVDLKL